MSNKPEAQLLVEAFEFAMSRRFRLPQEGRLSARMTPAHVDALLHFAAQIQDTVERQSAAAPAGGTH
jgi:hypothetical protein